MVVCGGKFYAVYASLLHPRNGSQFMTFELCCNQFSLAKMAEKQRRKLWSEESLREAVASVKNGNPLRKAFREYNVPVETLRRRMSGAVTEDCRPRPSTVLTKGEEECLAKYVIEMADRGFGLSSEDLMRASLVNQTVFRERACAHERGRGGRKNTYFPYGLVHGPLSVSLRNLGVPIRFAMGWRVGGGWRRSGGVTPRSLYELRNPYRTPEPLLEVKT